MTLGFKSKVRNSSMTSCTNNWLSPRSWSRSGQFQCQVKVRMIANIRVKRTMHYDLGFHLKGHTLPNDEWNQDLCERSLQGQDQASVNVSWRPWLLLGAKLSILTLSFMPRVRPSKLHKDESNHNSVCIHFEVIVNVKVRVKVDININFRRSFDTGQLIDIFLLNSCL